MSYFQNSAQSSHNLSFKRDGNLPAKVRQPLNFVMPGMELANFSINKDLISLEVGGVYLDLHNNFDFGGYSKYGATIEIKLTVTAGDWVPAITPVEILLRFERVSYFEARGNLGDATNIDEMGFFENTTQGKVEYNGSNTPSKGADLLVFRFVGGGELAVCAEKATCIATSA